MKPSLAVLAASDKRVVGTPPGCSPCASWCYSAVAAAVVVGIAAVADDGDGAVGDA